jgi:hypothetical protein
LPSAANDNENAITRLQRAFQRKRVALVEWTEATNIDCKSVHHKRTPLFVDGPSLPL